MLQPAMHIGKSGTGVSTTLCQLFNYSHSNTSNCL